MEEIRYFKSYRYIDGRAKWIIIDENGNIINRNPPIEQIKMAILEDHNSYMKSKFEEKRKRKKCCKCGSNDTYIYNNNPIRCACECGKKGCTGLLCMECYAIYDPGSQNNLIKSIANHRTGNLDPSSTSGKGFIGTQIIAVNYKVEDCNLKMGNFCFYVDLPKITGYGYSEVKIASFNMTNGEWSFNTKREQEYEALFLVCMDRNWPWKNVERVYTISKKEVIKHGQGIRIMKNPSWGGWYRKFEINVKSFNDTYHNMKLENCKVLKH